MAVTFALWLPHLAHKRAAKRAIALRRFRAVASVVLFSVRVARIVRVRRLAVATKMARRAIACKRFRAAGFCVLFLVRARLALQAREAARELTQFATARELRARDFAAEEMAALEIAARKRHQESAALERRICEAPMRAVANRETVAREETETNEPVIRELLAKEAVAENTPHHRRLAVQEGVFQNGAKGFAADSILHTEVVPWEPAFQEGKSHHVEFSPAILGWTTSADEDSKPAVPSAVLLAPFGVGALNVSAPTEGDLVARPEVAP